MYTALRRFSIPVLLMSFLGMTVSGGGPGVYAQAAQPGCRTFPETGKAVCGRFLQYWDTRGGLAQQGYPISGEFREVSEINGTSYLVQYFERAVFEYHPENEPPYDVLLSLLGRMKLKERYPAPEKVPDGDGGVMQGESRTFRETGKTVSGPFLKYWQEHGGLAQQGFPISNAMFESVTRTAPARIVQYFERAVFELHPENEERFAVLLSRLGAERFENKYPYGEPPAGGDVWSRLHTPLNIPRIGEGEACPADSAKMVNPQVGLALGDGPAYPVGFDRDGVYDYSGTIEEGGWYLLKVLWIVDPDAYSGPVLVRGRQLDGPNEMRFGPGSSPISELRLDPKEAITGGEGDWPNWPTYTRVRTPGCYAYQIDGTSFTKVITFRAVDGR